MHEFSNLTGISFSEVDAYHPAKKANILKQAALSLEVFRQNDVIEVSNSE